MSVGTNLPLWRRLPTGAELAPEGGVHFRVWAPDRRRVRVLFEGFSDLLERVGPSPEAELLRSPEPARSGRTIELERDDDGYFAGTDMEASGGSCYRFLLDDDPQPYPDPTSRWQPRGPHGESCVVDPAAYQWRDNDWEGVAIEGQVIYELHIGTFTPEGSWAAATRELPALADLGVTVLEVLPVADFPGLFGWGYDGVNWFAPTRLYGTPDDFRRFVDAAHGLGLGVILDVVYNHFGPDGNYLAPFSAHYFTHRHVTDWGAAINFDDEQSAAARELVTSNARYWVDEFHLDGLRLDATQSMFDDSSPHIVTELVQAARVAAGQRRIIVVAENELQDAWLARPREAGGAGIDALWNDDYHHSAHVATTGDSEGFFSAYRGTPQEFVSMAKYGWLYQGQFNSWQGERRGSAASDLRATQFVNFIQNHDQISNNGPGRRAHELTSPGRHRAITALTLLLPQTPMLFQGQEFNASAPFPYFADHRSDLGQMVAVGRRQFLSQFASLALPEVQATLPDPTDPITFQRAKLDLAERETNAAIYDLHRDLLRLRREDGVLGAARLSVHGRAVDGAVLADSAFVIRYATDNGNDRLLIINLGGTLRLEVLPDPLLAPPEGGVWRTIWSSENPRYGGTSTPPLGDVPQPWHIPAECAVVLSSQSS